MCALYILSLWLDPHLSPDVPNPVQHEACEHGKRFRDLDEARQGEALVYADHFTVVGSCSCKKDRLFVEHEFVTKI